MSFSSEIVIESDNPRLSIPDLNSDSYRVIESELSLSNKPSLDKNSA